MVQLRLTITRIKHNTHNLPEEIRLYPHSKKSHRILLGSDLTAILQSLDDDVMRSAQIQRYVSSGFDSVIVHSIDILLTTYQAFTGSSFIELPGWIKEKQCCINIKNTDDRCFEYAVKCGIKTILTNKNHPHSDRVSTWIKTELPAGPQALGLRS